MSDARPNSCLYLHETVDIVGEGAVPYMVNSVLGFDPVRAADRGLALFGTWQVMGSTGRWPQVINVWELADGWESWRRLCESTNLRRESNEALRDWWREASQWRSGGFDRLLAAADGSPALADLRVAGVNGSLFTHEISEVRPGAARAYLAAVLEEWAPVCSEHGHRLVGLWDVHFTDAEVVTSFATDLDAHVAIQRSGDPRIAAWRRRAREFVTRSREEMLVPCPGMPLFADSVASG